VFVYPDESLICYFKHSDYNQERMRRVRVIVRMDGIPKVIPRELFLDQIPRGSRNSQSYDADFSRVDSACAFTRIVILHENLHVTLVGTVSEEELGTMAERP